MPDPAPRPTSGAVTVEEVTGGKALVRFTELPQALHGRDPRWAPPVMAWERYRLDAHRNPYFELGDAAYLLARRLGQPAGRVVAHVAEPGGEGRFGFWTVIDDIGVATALVEAAQRWLHGQGCTSMTGPLSYVEDDEPGVQVAGFEHAGVTGRPWQPPHEAALLEALGFEAVAERPTWRLRALGGECALATGDDVPGQAGPYADRRLVLDGAAAVPDVAAALRTAGLRSAWSLAKRARVGDWEACTVVRCDVDPAVAVPALRAAAGAAGYREIIAPWSPDPLAEPEAVHRRYRLTW